MKRIIYALIIIGMLSQAYAQKKQEIAITVVNKATVDADLSEWTAMTAVVADSSWTYQLAYDTEHIYIAVRILDPMLQNWAARDGILVSFLPDSKREKAPTLIFPFPDGETIRALRQSEISDDVKMRNELIARTRGYQLRGFARILDGPLSFQNGYGIKAAAQAVKGEFTYEAAIPRKQLALSGDTFLLSLGINDRSAAQSASRSAASADPRMWQRKASTAREKSKLATQVLLNVTMK